MIVDVAFLVVLILIYNELRLISTRPVRAALREGWAR